MKHQVSVSMIHPHNLLWYKLKSIDISLMRKTLVIADLRYRKFAFNAQVYFIITAGCAIYPWQIYYFEIFVYLKRIYYIYNVCTKHYKKFLEHEYKNVSIPIYSVHKSSWEEKKSIIDLTTKVNSL